MDIDYKMGTGNGPVTIAVRVGSPVPSATLVFLSRKGAPNKKLAKSDKITCHVKRTEIGIPSDFAQSSVIIRTTLLCTVLDPDEWSHVPNVLSIQYELDGGTDGLKQGSQDPDDLYIDPSGKSIIVTKKFNIK
jgi:hypothetical protein